MPDLTKSVAGRTAVGESPVLEVQGVSVRFGGLSALTDVSLQVAPGRITAIIGPNGAGKSTLMNAITGFQQLTAGRVSLRGKDITGLAPHRAVGLGMARTFQDLEVMQRLTVAENVLLALQDQPGERLRPLLLSPRSTRRRYLADVQRVIDTLSLVGIVDSADMLAAALSYGQQKLLVLARLLATDAELLMLDEPGAGLPEANLHQIGKILRDMVDHQGKSVLLVDHNMELIMTYADHVIVLHHGQIIASGTPKEIQADSRVINVYFSRADHDGAAAGGTGGNGAA